MTQVRQGRLLVVDDEAEIREIVMLNSLPLGFEVIEAADGREALDILQQRPVDVIISDLMMPRMTGTQLLAEARNAGFSQPFIFLTAYPSQDSTLQALRLGAFDYIEKPFEGDDLRALLTEAMRVSLETQQLDVQVSGEIKKLRTLRFAGDNATPAAASASAQKLQDLFISEATPQLLFCDASIRGITQPDDRAFELGYLFRVMQGVAVAAESIGAQKIAELARASELYYMSLRVHPTAVDSRAVELAEEANRSLQLLLTTLGREPFPDVSATIAALHAAASELESRSARAG